MEKNITFGDIAIIKQKFNQYKRPSLVRKYRLKKEFEYFIDYKDAMRLLWLWDLFEYFSRKWVYIKYTLM